MRGEDPIPKRPGGVEGDNPPLTLIIKKIKNKKFLKNLKKYLEFKKTFITFANELGIYKY
jgi:hypothetical protein